VLPLLSPLPIDKPEIGRTSIISAGTCCTEGAAIFTDEEGWYLLVNNAASTFATTISATSTRLARKSAATTPRQLRYDDEWLYDHYWETPEQIEEYAEAVLRPREEIPSPSPSPSSRDRTHHSPHVKGFRDYPPEAT